VLGGITTKPDFGLGGPLNWYW